MRQVAHGFPCCIVIWVTYPFDQVFLLVVLCAVIKDVFNFIFRNIVDSDRRRRWVSRWSVWELGWVLVWS
jgi:hypothetical protein